MKNKTQHTPTPWRIDKEYIVSADIKFPSTVLRFDYTVPIIRQANAAFIVRAVNNHENLLNTLRIVARGSCLRQINTSGACICYPCIAQKAITEVDNGRGPK